MSVSGSGPWRRLSRATLGLWLAVTLGEPAMLHVCPMHDAPSGFVASGALLHTSRERAHGLPEHIHSPSPSPDGGDGAHHCCTCMGPCCTAGAVVVPTGTLGHVAEPSLGRAAVSHSAQSTFRPSEVEHARPPSVGPPTLPA
jgi:hypothetical protein